MLARRSLLALAAVADVAIHARGKPVAAKALAARNGLAPRHLEPLLQDLVRADILRGTRGPRGGYELARERRRISVGDVVRALEQRPSGEAGARAADLLEDVIAPMIGEAVDVFLATLDGITVEDLCRRAEQRRIGATSVRAGEFHI